MIAQIFTQFIGIFQAIFSWMQQVWLAVGNFGVIFLGIFTILTVFRFILYPFLAGRAFGIGRVIEPRENSDHYQDTKIGFTAGF